MTYAVVVPTVGRPSLGVLLRSLAAQDGPAPVRVVVVDDRPLTQPPLDPTALLTDPHGAGGAVVHPAPWPLTVLRSGGRGPAAARNVGWRSVTTPWVAFLDDDVVLPSGWTTALAADLEVPATVGGTQGRLTVPLPDHRPPTDWERSTAGLEHAAWATADMTYRRAALAAVHGFDERFPRAYREDADLALRVRAAGWSLVRGRRRTVHPVRPADDRVSIRVQAGAADDALMRALHGPHWRQVAETGRGRFPFHVATVVAAGGAVAAALARRRGPALAAAAGWLLLTLDLLRVRVLPGPRPGDDGWRAEWRRMATTSAVIPVAAVRHRARGELRHRRVPGWLAGARRHEAAEPWPVPVRAVLLDRDGTLVHDVPYNGDPALVRVVDGARAALDALRQAGLAVGVVTNQSGIARGLVTEEQVAAVHRRIEQELGPVDVWLHCPHGPEDGCTCRKPAPGMVLDAARRLGVPPYECAVVGDIAADVGAAVAAGARAVLVPDAATRPDEVAAVLAAGHDVVPDLAAAVGLLLGGPPQPEEVAA